jgi:hypothetical protein
MTSTPARTGVQGALIEMTPARIDLQGALIEVRAGIMRVQAF